MKLTRCQIKRNSPFAVWRYSRLLALKIRWWRLQVRLDRLYCRAGVIFRLRNPAACRGCGKTDLDAWDPTGADTWCTACCPDHDFKSERYRSGAWCTHCGEPAPFDWHCD